jgi:hypothetical protein
MRGNSFAIVCATRMSFAKRASNPKSDACLTSFAHGAPLAVMLSSLIG